MRLHFKFGSTALLTLLPTLLLTLAAARTGFSAEQISLSGTVQAIACTQACGTCCGTHGLTDTSGNLYLQIGNAFVDLAKIADDGEVHQVTGHYYNTTGQCGVGACTLFAVETVDTQAAAPANFQSATGRLSIQSVVIDGDTTSPYRVTLTPPFTVESTLEHSELDTIAQGGDCSGADAVCTSGTVCLSYYGIAGASGPEFKTCEIPCTHPGASCPLGQSCVTIADGPGQVCTAD